MKRSIRSLIFFLPSLCMAEPTETLERLISSALQVHPAIQSQRAQQQGAQAEVDSATAQFFPTPSVTVEKAHTRNSAAGYQGDSTVSTLRLQQPLWTGGRLTAGKDKAEAGVVVSQATLDEVRLRLALQVVQAYSDWLAAHLKMQASEKNLATHVRLRDQVTRRIEQGVSSDSDLILAIGRLKSVAADMSLVRAQKEIALARLGQLTGHRIADAALSGRVATPRALSSDPQALLDLALAGNPAIRKAQAQAAIQQSVVKERRAELSPEIYVRAERQFGNYTVGNSPPENRVFIGLTSHFGAGLSSLSNIESAKAQEQAALAEVEVQKLAVTEQVLTDYALASASESRLDALKASLDSVGEVAKSYDRQFLAGRKSWLDVMNAARELAQTESQLADIQSAQVVATWRLALYTQGVASVSGSAQ